MVVCHHHVSQLSDYFFSGTSNQLTLVSVNSRSEICINGSTVPQGQRYKRRCHELANLQTNLRFVQETVHSSVLSHSLALRFAQDLLERRSTLFFRSIEVEWDDI